jgi:hypothetical protein
METKGFMIPFLIILIALYALIQEYLFVIWSSWSFLNIGAVAEFFIKMGWRVVVGTFVSMLGAIGCDGA